MNGVKNSWRSTWCISMNLTLNREPKPVCAVGSFKIEVILTPKTLHA